MSDQGSQVMKMLKEEIGATCGIITLAVLLLLGVYFGVLSVGSVLSNASWFIFAGMVGLFLWGFRQRIDIWFRKIPPSSSAPPKPVNVDSNARIKRSHRQRRSDWSFLRSILHRTEQEPEPEDYSPQTEGKHYKSRSELQPFDEMLSIANNTIDMSGLDFRKVVHEFMTIIRQLVHKNIRITFLLLDPNSEQVKIQSKNFYAVEDLKGSIQKSIKLLCEEKEKLPPYMRGNLIIRLYDYPPEHSIIIINEGHENAWIKVEARPLGSDSNSRPSSAWYKKYDPGEYSQYMHEYDTLFNKSKECRCPIF